MNNFFVICHFFVAYGFQTYLNACLDIVIFVILSMTSICTRSPGWNVPSEKSIAICSRGLHVSPEQPEPPIHWTPVCDVLMKSCPFIVLIVQETRTPFFKIPALRFLF